MYVGFCFKPLLPCSSSIYCVPLCYIEYRAAPRACQLTYVLYVRVVILGVLSRHSSIYRTFKNGTIFIVMYIEKNCYTVFHSKHLFLSIEKAERSNARQFLLFAVQIDFYAEIFVRKE